MQVKLLALLGLGLENAMHAIAIEEVCYSSHSRKPGLANSQAIHIESMLILV